MTDALTIAALAGICIFVWVIWLYRKQRLKDDHALLWIFVSGTIIVLSLSNQFLVDVKELLGAANASDVVLSAFVAFLLVVSIYYSVKISMLERQNRKLAQELAVIRVIAVEHGTITSAD